MLGARYIMSYVTMFFEKPALANCSPYSMPVDIPAINWVFHRMF